MNTSIVDSLLNTAVEVATPEKLSVEDVVKALGENELIAYAELKVRIGATSRFSNVGKKLDLLSLDLQEKVVDATTKIPGAGFWKKLIAEANGDAEALNEIRGYEKDLRARNSSKVVLGGTATKATVLSKLAFLRARTTGSRA